MTLLSVTHSFAVRAFRTVLILVFANFTFHSNAQEEYKPKLGLIDRAALDMTAYPGDSTADAVILYDYGDVNFHYDDRRGITMTMKCWMRVKILKESALERASVTLPYIDQNSFANSEVIDEIKGYTYNLVDNKIVTSELDRKSIKTEKIAENYWSKKLNLPNVKKGSVFEYTYTVTSPLSVKEKPSTWSFQGSIPIKWSEYKIVIPYLLYYKITMGGYLNLDVTEREQVNVLMGHSKFDGPGMRYRFALKNAPAFNSEPFITTPSDYISKISFELESIAYPGEPIRNFSRNWDKVDDTYMQASWFGAELRKNIFPKEIREELLQKGTDSTSKMNAGYTYMQQNMKWDETGGFGSRSGLKRAFENKKGSATEINLLLTNLLRDLGLDCEPVILSTRSHGKVFEHMPSFDAFNYTVSRVKIGDKEYLLDASQAFGKPGMLPEHALSEIGRVVPKKGKGYFIDLKPRESKNTLIMMDADILPEDGILKGTYGASLGGYDALHWREEYANEPEQVYLEAFKKQYPEWKIDKVTVSNKSENLLGTVNVRVPFELEDENASPGVFYFNPMLANRMTENPLKSPERIYPLNLATGISTSYIGTYKLPEGYVIEEIPKTEIVVLPEKAGKFLYQVKQTGNIIQVNSSMTVSKLMFIPDEYHALREFFERVVQKHAQPIVIKKK